MEKVTIVMQYGNRVEKEVVMEITNPKGNVLRLYKPEEKYDECLICEMQCQMIKMFMSCSYQTKRPSDAELKELHETLERFGL